MTPVRNPEDNDINSNACEITACGSPTYEHVEHPQRGEMAVCRPHAREIKALPSWRFIGSNDRWPEVAR